MCVAVPGKVETILDRTEFSIPAMVSFPSGSRRIDLVMVPDAQPGDHVITHSGYAVAPAPAPEVAD